jgi:hypothetical protein
MTTEKAVCILLLAGSLYKISRDRFLILQIILVEAAVGDVWLETGSDKPRKKIRIYFAY